EKESDKVIKSSVEDLVPIPSESEETSNNDSECDLPFCDDSSPLDILGGDSVIFSNPLFDFNVDFTFCDGELFPDEDDIENKDSYVSNLDEQALLVTHLFELNKDERHSSTLSDDTSSPLPPKELYFADLKMIKSSIDTPPDFEDDYYNSEGDIIYLESLLIKDTTHNLPPEVFFDHDPRSLKDEHDNDNLKSMVKVFDLGIHKKIISPTNVRFTFEDHHYFSLTFVIRIFLPYLTYFMASSFLLSSGSENTILTLASPLLVSIP
ncbi:hypothetical protein Tco_1527590, partial [Tanacetum coccineum]